MNRINLKLGVNIDHVATLRQARGVDYPSVIDAAGCCEAAGAHSITVHLREDRRHIQDQDVYDLRSKISTRLNLEMANTPEIVKIAVDVHPDEVCLVPEKRQELTTEGGLDVAGQKSAIATTVKVFIENGIVPSLFIDPEPDQIRASAEVGAPCIELHTGTFCDAPRENAAIELERLINGAKLAHDLGIQVNAGHGINLQNLDAILDIPFLDTLNIGHSIVARAVFVSMENAVREMLVAMERG
ncbi:MAG: pyridoxine 5'-phosphate synthase [Kiritimatiellae bacterium]|nr:pyridoxine 5'-phosphate synthase [Kiritimatiellia bacterium]